MVGWRHVVAALALAGCGWDVPRPHVARRDAAPDLAADLGDGDGDGPDVVPDQPPPLDAAPAPDAAPDAVDVPRDTPGETGADAPPVVEGGATDVLDAGPGDDAGVRDAPAGETDGADGACAPGSHRGCYTGPTASRGQGVCRDGTQTCDPGGAWGSCAGQVVPDCLARECGSDDCGGTCGPCPTGGVCDDTGRCITRPCGPDGFSMACPDHSACPPNSTCVTGGLCACNPGFLGVDCTGRACGSSCTYPNWVCAPEPFCGTGSVLCPSGVRCPRHGSCSPTGSCVCDTGFAATTCGGTPCAACTGLNYHCVPPAGP